MKLATVLVLSSLSLTGCGTISSFKPTQKQVNLVLTKCPVLRNYTKTEMRQAASELQNIPSNAQLARMIGDYGKLRQACRVITKKLN
jgi:hypothetical protein